MLPEYDFSKGVRGKHYKAYRKGHSVKIHKTDGTTRVQHFKFEDGAVMLEPDVRVYFRDSEAVNSVLRSLITLVPPKRRTTVKTKTINYFFNLFRKVIPFPLTIKILLCFAHRGASGHGVIGGHNAYFPVNSPMEIRSDEMGRLLSNQHLALTRNHFALYLGPQKNVPEKEGKLTIVTRQNIRTLREGES